MQKLDFTQISQPKKSRNYAIDIYALIYICKSCNKRQFFSFKSYCLMRLDSWWNSGNPTITRKDICTHRNTVTSEMDSNQVFNWIYWLQKAVIADKPLNSHKIWTLGVMESWNNSRIHFSPARVQSWFGDVVSGQVVPGFDGLREESGISSVQPETPVMHLQIVPSKAGIEWSSEEFFYGKIKGTVR